MLVRWWLRTYVNFQWSTPYVGHNNMWDIFVFLDIDVKLRFLISFRYCSFTRVQKYSLIQLMRALWINVSDVMQVALRWRKVGDPCPTVSFEGSKANMQISCLGTLVSVLRILEDPWLNKKRYRKTIVRSLDLVFMRMMSFKRPASLIIYITNQDGYNR